MISIHRAGFVELRVCRVNFSIISRCKAGGQSGFSAKEFAGVLFKYATIMGRGRV